MNWPDKITKDDFDILSKEWELAGYVIHMSELPWTPLKTKLLSVYEKHDPETSGLKYVYQLVAEYALEWDEELERVLVRSDFPQGIILMTANQLGL